MNMVNGKKAFTLMEMIVSLAITSVIALFVFSFSSSLAELWRNSESGVSTELDAQIALDRIVKDFESAIFQERGVPMLAVTAIPKSVEDGFDVSFSGRWQTESTEGTGNPVDAHLRASGLHFDPENHRYGYAGVWLRFFSAAPNLNAIGYQIVRRPAFTSSSEPRYLLHRAVVRQDNTLEAGFDITSTAYNAAPSSDISAGVVESPWLTNVLLEDVVDFGIRMYVFDESFNGNDDAPKGLRLIFPSANNVDLDSNETEHLASTHAESAFSTNYPDVVEIYLRVLDDAGARSLIYSEEVEAGEPYETLIGQHGRVYRRMVRLPGKESAL
ncbi:PulJ/GspJ family protein [Pelagicoccus mobilis]|uniref:Prepilin-type N-terminal cleavage/methylation domain-containing protein n=1 Tax=Pelagicoccus mobilis TaxID=415221 RepID=A0A934VKC8_9BACT|nr:prepilin-type N-terminal cleavage/methylation domain-containing protein [Pelagicoccus mobilis]MBK1876531.1 prepilin-type N-terminal cleavage/methylation domain-containing protein [Pelagicoccus mobilis]